MRRLGDRRRRRSLPHGEGRADHPEAAPLPEARVDGQQGDRHHHHSPGELHRGCWHHVEGSSRRRPQARRGTDGRPAVPHPDQDVHRQREHVLRQLRPAKGRGVLQPAPQSDELEDMAGRQRSDPGCVQRRFVLGQRRPRTAARSTRSTPTRCGAVTPSASSATAPTADSSCATAGARAGASTDSAISTPTTSLPRSSTSRTASRSDGHQRALRYDAACIGLRPMAITDNPNGRLTLRSSARSARAT